MCWQFCSIFFSGQGAETLRLELIRLRKYLGPGTANKCSREPSRPIKEKENKLQTHLDGQAGLHDGHLVAVAVVRPKGVKVVAVESDARVRRLGGGHRPDCQLLEHSYHRHSDSHAEWGPCVSQLIMGGWPHLCTCLTAQSRLWLEHALVWTYLVRVGFQVDVIAETAEAGDRSPKD
jgi:hypothetical protein